MANTISKCKRSLEQHGYGTAAVVFLVSQVGDAADGAKYIRDLDRDERIRDIVFCSMDKLDEMLARFQRERNDSGYTAWVRHFNLPFLCPSSLLLEIALTSVCSLGPLVDQAIHERCEWSDGGEGLLNGE